LIGVDVEIPLLIVLKNSLLFIYLKQHMAMKQILLSAMLTFLMNCVHAQSERSDAYSAFSSARNQTSQSTLGLRYYSESQFTRLAEAAQHLYSVTDQSETVSSLRRENRELQTQVDALNSKIQAMEKAKEITPQKEMKSVNVAAPTEDDAPIVKHKSLTDWVSDNVLLLILSLGGGIFYISQKRKVS
jgi:septal ring factor EnvC (AmiA/AmiB activator)